MLEFNLFQQAGHKIVLPCNDVVQFSLAWCPAGEFMANSPKRYLRLSKGFWIAHSPVTQEQWQFVLNRRNRLFDEGVELPAEGITWEEANEFCYKLTLILQEHGFIGTNQLTQLPTVVQWEYACSTGSSTRWYFGDDEAELQNHGWYIANSGNKKQRVCQKLPNSWGIFDLYGNVREWCVEEIHRKSYSDSVLVDPIFVSKSLTTKITKGGCFSDLSRVCNSFSDVSIESNNPFNEATGVRFIIVSV